MIQLGGDKERFLSWFVAVCWNKEFNYTRSRAHVACERERDSYASGINGRANRWDPRERSCGIREKCFNSDHGVESVQAQVDRAQLKWLKSQI